MKKEPFKNLLLRFFRKCGIKYVSINGAGVIINSPFMHGFVFRPDRNYCCVSTLVNRLDAININFCVNYSIETLLYKLYKHALINEKLYSELLKKWLA